MAEVTLLFSQLVQAAVEACGSNSECLLAYFEEHRAKLSPNEQEQLKKMFDHIIGFQEPDKPFQDN